MLHHDSIARVAALIERREISPVELTEATLERIGALDAQLHAFMTVSADFALRQARLAENEIAAGNYRGPLHGIPYAAKDLIDTEGIRTTCGSKILRDRVPAGNATVIRRLHEAGAVLVGKLVMTEFAGIGYHPTVVPPRNPWNAGSLDRPVLQRVGRGHGRGSLFRRPRHRHRREPALPGQRLQGRRCQADLWARQPARRVPPCRNARFRRPHRAHCRRRLHRSQRHRGGGRARSDLVAGTRFPITGPRLPTIFCHSGSGWRSRCWSGWWTPK